MPMCRPCAGFTARVFVVLVSFLTISACARQEVGNRALEYNNALSDFGNKQILLNAVRSAKRLPQYYAAVGNLTGDETLTGSVDGSFPFGRNTTNPFSLSPSIAASSGISSFQVGNLNKGEFVERLLEEVKADLFLYYQDNRWNLELLINILISHITLPENFSKGLDLFIREYCQTPNEEDAANCYWLNMPFASHVPNSECEPSPFPRLNDKRNKIVVVYSNHGRDSCQLLQFQTFVRKLLVLGPRLVKIEASTEPRTYEEIVEAKIPTKGATTVTTKYKKKPLPLQKKPTYKIVFLGRSTHFKSNKSGIKAVKRNLKRGLNLSDDSRSFSFALRSPQAMVYYLGELIAAQVFQNSHYQASVINKGYGKDGHKSQPLLVDLFVVEQGSPAGATVSVYHQDGWYNVPKPNFGSKTAHRSLQVITLINQIIALQTQAGDVPQQTNVNLIAN